MLTTSTLMDAAKHGQSISSDYRLAKVLGASENTLYYWRRGRACDDDYATKMALMAGAHVGYVLVCIAAERAKDPATKEGYQAAALALETLSGMDKMSKQLRTPDRPQMPMNKGFATMATGEREYTLTQVTRTPAPALALLGVAWISGRKALLTRGSVDSVRP